MLIQFSPKEFDSIQIVPINKSYPDDKQYFELREEVWNNQLEKNSSSRQWNGRIYTCESLVPASDSTAILYMGICEYKDILINRIIGTQELVNRFGKEATTKHISMQTFPITNDNLAVLGIASGKTITKEGQIVLIGGTANEDEMKVNGIKDLEKFLSMEIEEELGVDSQGSTSEMIGINSFMGEFTFNYKVQLPYSKEDILKGLENSNEFEQLLFVGEGELRSKAKEFELHTAVQKFFDAGLSPF